MRAMHASDVESTTHRQSIGEGAQRTKRRGAGAAQHRIGVFGTRERTRARADSFNSAIGKRTGHGHGLATSGSRSLFGEILPHTPLVVLGHECALVFVAAIEDRKLERQAGVFEQRGVLCPRDDGAGRHHSR